jgi:hypothetical protein
MIYDDGVSKASVGVRVALHKNYDAVWNTQSLRFRYATKSSCNLVTVAFCVG